MEPVRGEREKRGRERRKRKKKKRMSGLGMMRVALKVSHRLRLLWCPSPHRRTQARGNSQPGSSKRENLPSERTVPILDQCL
jgi:hypothetical protein